MLPALLRRGNRSGPYLVDGARKNLAVSGVRCALLEASKECRPAATAEDFGLAAATIFEFRWHPSCRHHEPRTSLMGTDRTNAEWLTALLGGGTDQHAALDDLRRYLLRALRKAFARDRHLHVGFVEDMAQEALLRILERLPQFEGRSRFLTWAAAIAIRVAMSELRRRRWRDVSLDALVEQGVDAREQESAENADALLMRSERSMIVETMYDVIRGELTERQRRALLAELRGMPQVEIARQLGSNRNAIYKLTHDARKRLKRGLEAAGYRADTVQAAFFT